MSTKEFIRAETENFQWLRLHVKRLTRGDTFVFDKSPNATPPESDENLSRFKVEGVGLGETGPNISVHNIDGDWQGRIVPGVHGAIDNYGRPMEYHEYVWLITLTKKSR